MGFTVLNSAAVKYRSSSTIECHQTNCDQFDCLKVEKLTTLNPSSLLISYELPFQIIGLKMSPLLWHCIA
jgi:hypothetical protein